jgi:hypothetical protein
VKRVYRRLPVDLFLEGFVQQEPEVRVALEALHADALLLFEEVHEAGDQARALRQPRLRSAACAWPSRPALPGPA